MKSILNAVYGGSKINQFKTKDNLTIDYINVNLLGVGEQEDEHLVVSCSKDVDLKSLVRFKEYNFVIDLTNGEKGKKVKIVGLLPFDNKK